MIANTTRRIAARAFSNSRLSRHSSLPASANAEELEHFAELAKSWWDPNGPQRILHKMNLLRVDYIRDTLGKYGHVGKKSQQKALPGYSLDLLPEKQQLEIAANQLEPWQLDEKGQHRYSVLDIGCGGGLLAESLGRSQFVKKVLGIDATPEVIKVAEEHRQNDPMLAKKLEYRNLGVEQLGNEQYDLVTLFEIVEHVAEPSEFLRHAASKVKKGGFIFLSTINRTVVSYLSTILFGEHLLRIVPPGTHTWSKYVNQTELRDWFVPPHSTKPEWEFIRSDGCIFMPAVGWKLVGNADMGNYFMVVRRL